MTPKGKDLKAALESGTDNLRSLTSGCGLKDVQETIEKSEKLTKTSDRRVAKVERAFINERVKALVLGFERIEEELTSIIAVYTQLQGAIAQRLSGLQTHPFRAQLPLARDPRTGEIDVALWAEQEFGLRQVHVRWLIRDWRVRMRRVTPADYHQTAKHLTGGMPAEHI